MRRRATALTAIANRGVVITAAAPVNTVAPVVSGTPYAGYVLSVTDGAWTGAPSFTYQWQRNGSNIGGATSSTYPCVYADNGAAVRCIVTGTNGLGSASANSNALELFIPSDLGTSVIKGWYDAKDTSTITLATGVSAWADKSGNGNDFTQSTGASQPAYTSGSHLTFDANTTELNRAPIYSLDRVILAVFNNTGSDTSTYTSLVSQDSGATVFDWTMIVRSGSNILRIHTSYVDATSAYRSVELTYGTKMLATVRSGSPRQAALISVNGSASVSSTTTSAECTQTATTLRIGNNAGNNTRAFGGTLNEVILAPTVLSDADIAKLEGYMAWANNTVAALDAGHAYKSTPPTP